MEVKLLEMDNYDEPLVDAPLAEIVRFLDDPDSYASAKELLTILVRVAVLYQIAEPVNTRLNIENALDAEGVY